MQPPPGLFSSGWASVPALSDPQRHLAQKMEMLATNALIAAALPHAGQSASRIVPRGKPRAA